MQFRLDGPVFEGARCIINLFGIFLPGDFTGPEDELLAGRRTAWLGVCLNCTPVYDVYGPDVITFLNRTCVNRDFSTLDYGFSKHVLICNEQGKMLADGVMIKVGDNRFRTYWLAPALQYFVESSGLNVKGEYVDEYFYQIDGPKSLEIMEEACQCDLHDLKFARNKKARIAGKEVLVHRLGMSGALAYEVHGPAEDAEVVYIRLWEAVEQFGGRRQGILNYGIVNHTVAGYPNQFQHFWYPLLSSGEGLAEFAKRACPRLSFTGSASDDENNFYVTPYDVGWGYLVNFAHDFMGKKALLEIAKNPPRKMVTLEWNTEDVGDVFMSQFRGQDVAPYDRIEWQWPFTWAVRGDYVLADGKKIGVATGKTYAYYERRMVSLACIDKEYAVEGKEVTVLWGSPGHPQKEIRATVARFPYYQGEYRNETFDVEKIPRRFSR